MTVLVKLFGIFALIFGIAIAIKPLIINKYFSFCKKGNYLKIGGIIAILVGIIFLIAAPGCRLAWLITILGIWSIIKGILLLVVSREKLFAYLDWWQSKPSSALRILGVITIIIGGLLIYSV